MTVIRLAKPTRSAYCGCNAIPGKGLLRELSRLRNHPTMIWQRKSIPFGNASVRFRLLSPRELAQHSAAGRWPSKKETIVQDEDIKLLRRIVASGGRKYTAGNIDRSKYDRLVEMGWLMPFKTNISDVEYQATDKGRTAAVANGR